jgi:uncharacterized protein (TIGR03083 family)
MGRVPLTMNAKDLSATYRQSRERLTDLAADLTDADVNKIVLASPAWTVRDTYAHLVGAAADVVAGRVDGAGTDAWTAAQVAERGSVTLADQIEEWVGVGPDFEAAIERNPGNLWRFVGGTWLHEQDIRGTVGLRGLRHTDGCEVACGLVDAIGVRIADAGLAPLTILTGDRRWVLGDGGGEVTLSIDAYELARAVGGRRSPAQMAAYDWSADPTPYVPLIATYGPTEVDLHD